LHNQEYSGVGVSKFRGGSAHRGHSAGRGYGGKHGDDNDRDYHQHGRGGGSARYGEVTPYGGRGERRGGFTGGHHHHHRGGAGDYQGSRGFRGDEREVGGAMGEHRDAYGKNVQGRRLFVSNLAFETQWKYLKDHMR